MPLLHLSDSLLDIYPHSHYCALLLPFITQDGDSALTLAAWGGHTNVVVELVKAGADLDLQNKVQNYIEPLIAPRKIRFQHTTIIPYLIGERLVVTTADFSVLLRHCHRYRNVVRDSK